MDMVFGAGYALTINIDYCCDVNDNLILHEVHTLNYCRHRVIDDINRYEKKNRSPNGEGKGYFPKSIESCQKNYSSKIRSSLKKST